MLVYITINKAKPINQARFSKIQMFNNINILHPEFFHLKAIRRLQNFDYKYAIKNIVHDLSMIGIFKIKISMQVMCPLFFKIIFNKSYCQEALNLKYVI